MRVSQNFSTILLYSEYLFFRSQGHLEDLIEEKFPDHSTIALRDPILYGDYRNTLLEQPRLYEDLVDYDAAKAMFEEVPLCQILSCLSSREDSLILMVDGIF